MATTHEILLSHGEETDGTAFPFWAIVTKSGLGHRQIWIDGPWFNRKDAESYLASHAYRYPKTAFVYCFSGHNAPHLREMYENARAEAAS